LSRSPIGDSLLHGRRLRLLVLVLVLAELRRLRSISLPCWPSTPEAPRQAPRRRPRRLPQRRQQAEGREREAPGRLPRKPWASGRRRKRERAPGGAPIRRRRSSRRHSSRSRSSPNGVIPILWLLRVWGIWWRCWSATCWTATLVCGGTTLQSWTARRSC